MPPSPGRSVSSHLVSRLRKALYGLKQTPARKQGKALLLGFLDLKARWKGLFFLCVSPIRVFFDDGIIGTRPSALRFMAVLLRMIGFQRLP